MRRAIKWLILILLIGGYIYTIASWWQEGTDNFERQRIEACNEYQTDGTPLDKIPQGCRQ